MTAIWKDIVTTHDELNDKFAVDECPEYLLPSNFQSTNTYGNYLVDNSEMVFIPAFYYRIGNEDSLQFKEYGYNSIDIVKGYQFPSERIANKEGFVLHRAFIDGGKKKRGFFIDKFLASRDNNSCKSQKGQHPLSLSHLQNDNSSMNIEGCSGQYNDAITLASRRGQGFHCASVFQYNALGLLSLVIGQLAKNNEYCAWYNESPLLNSPRGCNEGLMDKSDSSVKYASSFLGKPLTGAIKGFNKTTHNGKENGVADLNGSMYQMLIGVTTNGNSLDDKTYYYDYKGYILKEEVRISDLTGGWNTKNAAWGDKKHLKKLYHEVDDLLCYDTKIGWWDLIHRNQQVFSPDVSGLGYYRTSIGVPMKSKTESQRMLVPPYSAVSNLAIMNSGGWNSASNGNIFTKVWFGHRSDSFFPTGFRCAFYPD